jgi:hypothetical protein
VLTASRIHNLALGCALAGSLLVSAISGTPAAQASEVTESSARAQERYYSSYGEPQPIDAGTASATAQERYYSSYGEPEPRTLTPSPSPSLSDDTPWLPIALSIAVTLAIVTPSALHIRRLRIRRRRAARVTT